MKNYLGFFLIFLLILFSACRSDFSTVPSSGNLQFSKTKIYLDTLFNNIGSSTYSLKVYNRSSSDVTIPKIQFGKGSGSKYRMIVDGMTGEDGDNNGIGDGKFFNNIEILAKDSLFIFIEITHNVPNPALIEFTYDDQILFDLGSNQQKVDLTTLIWDANFIFPNRPLSTGIKETLRLSNIATTIEGHLLSQNEHWTNQKPYLIYGYVQVPSGGNLIIDPGTRVYFHADSGIIIDEGGMININGGISTTSINNEVIFEGDRLEPFFENIPGQWGTVLIGSNGSNYISHLTLKNAVVGILVQKINTGASISPNLQINNSQIYNCSNFGILARNSSIVGKNLVINYSGQSNLGCVLGGNYNFIHCTFNNNWSGTNQKSVWLNNYDKSLVGLTPISITSSFRNCIIYGSNSLALNLEIIGSNLFIPHFNNCLLKFDETNASQSITTNINYDNIRTGNLFQNIINSNPKFKNSNKNQLNILTGSSAINMGQNLSPNFNDILNNPRPTSPNLNPDIGAYQF